MRISRKKAGGSSGGGIEIDINLIGQIGGITFSSIGQLTQANNISSMPANLTIVNQMTATNTWIVAAVGAFGAILGALAGGLATYLIEKLKIKNINTQRREQVYSQLMGRKETYLQLYSSFYVASIALEKVLAMIRFGFSIPDKELKDDAHKKDLENQLRFNQKIALDLENQTAELALEVGKASQELWETIGLVRILFPVTNDLNDKIDDIKKYKQKIEGFQKEITDEGEKGLIKFRYEPHGSRQNITTDWDKEKRNTLNEKYIKNLEDKIDNLLNYLEREINKEREFAK